MHTISDPELRFSFGKNWGRFLTVLNEERIHEAQTSLSKMLNVSELRNKSFLDAGCGSGLFSLAARRLGARVHSFDYDLDSVCCAEELRRRYFDGDAYWTIQSGSVLDTDFLRSLGRFDYVYCWGVLHHTGAMWAGLENITGNIKEDGKLFIAIYNDQGRKSKIWKKIKIGYNRLPCGLRTLYLLGITIPMEISIMIRSNPKLYVRTWTHYQSSRGMSRWHDLVDWIGGYPFEVARPEAVLDFCLPHGLQLKKLITCAGGLGCNQYVFHKSV